MKYYSMVYKNESPSNKLSERLLSLGIISYLSSMFIVAFNPNFDLRWIAFGFHIASILFLLWLYLLQYIPFNHKHEVLKREEAIPFMSIATITILANFSFLSLYPYVSISDEVRDAGLAATQVLSGYLKNFFDYGLLGAHGLIIPTLIIPFLYLFGHSVLTYRVPAALLSTADVLLLYFLIRITLNRTAAFWSALILATLPLHMFFAHTQVVIAFTFFWVPVILLILCGLLKRHSAADYIFLGTVLGFACQFHATLRAFCCVVLVILLFLEVKEMVQKKCKVQERLLIRLTKLVFLGIFFFVGFGPRIFFTSPQIFFHTNRLIYEKQLTSHAQLTTHIIWTIGDNYIKSLQVYTYSPTTYFYADNKPILSPLLALFFFIGIGYALFILKNTFVAILFAILIILPFFTSAITNWVNADYRASPLYAIATVFVGLGIACCLSLIKKKKLKYISTFLLLLFLAIRVITFYSQQSANKKMEFSKYLVMHAIYFLQGNTHYKNTNICLALSPYNFYYGVDTFSLSEQQEYFLPTTKLHLMQNNMIKNNEVYILTYDCSPARLSLATHTYTIACWDTNTFTCPPNYSGKLVLHY